MSSFVYMKVLESSPWRYDRGIRWLSGGHIEDLWRDIAARVSGPGRRVLDIGCGTGGASLACAALGGRVVGIDANAEMLAVARSKAPPGGAEAPVEWIQLDAAEIEDRFPEASFDGIVASLALSEMSAEEQAYTLRIARSRLKPRGRLVVADEVEPSGRLRRVWHRIRRAPLASLTWVLTQTSTQAIADLAGLVRAAGFVEVRETRPWSDDLSIVEARRPAAETG
jgi:ubiquinone/menaquinone biosynthesis C-methylase UbiE